VSWRAGSTSCGTGARWPLGVGDGSGATALNPLGGVQVRQGWILTAVETSSRRARVFASRCTEGGVRRMVSPACVAISTSSDCARIVHRLKAVRRILLEHLRDQDLDVGWESSRRYSRSGVAVPR
jgi:hypothetical protein